MAKEPMGLRHSHVPAFFCDEIQSYDKEIGDSSRQPITTLIALGVELSNKLTREASCYIFRCYRIA